MENTRNLVIVGAGPAGLTAAIYAGRANLNPMVLAGPLPGGLLTRTSDVENFPGFPEAINGFELMMKLQSQAEKFNIEMVYDSIESAELVPGGPHKLKLSSGDEIQCKALIIATGAEPRWLGLESEEKFKNLGVSACATCDGAFYRGEEVVVIGGGDSAMEEANFLTRFASHVTVIHRRDTLRASKIMADRALNNPKISFAWNSVVTEVVGSTGVDGVKIKNTQTGEESLIPCKGCFVALGHVPSTQPYAGQIDMDDAGFIQLKGGSSYTSMDGVFAAGDCADRTYRQAITAAAMGCRAAIDAERWLAE
ncbi:MAG: thioredoxin-disulfide reductase [Lentisphaeria bacterium]|nr:thioredoxin-disulfide reductase [Lentisphaeria bacterium]